jgi:hypothetical protein
VGVTGGRWVCHREGGWRGLGGYREGGGVVMGGEGGHSEGGWESAVAQRLTQPCNVQAIGIAMQIELY